MWNSEFSIRVKASRVTCEFELNICARDHDADEDAYGRRAARHRSLRGEKVFEYVSVKS